MSFEDGGLPHSDKIFAQCHPAQSCGYVGRSDGPWFPGQDPPHGSKAYEVRPTGQVGFTLYLYAYFTGPPSFSMRCRTITASEYIDPDGAEGPAPAQAPDNNEGCGFNGMARATSQDGPLVAWDPPGDTTGNTYWYGCGHTGGLAYRSMGGSPVTDTALTTWHTAASTVTPGQYACGDDRMGWTNGAGLWRFSFSFGNGNSPGFQTIKAVALDLFGPVAVDWRVGEGGDRPDCTSCGGTTTTTTSTTSTTTTTAPEGIDPNEAIVPGEVGPGGGGYDPPAGPAPVTDTSETGCSVGWDMAKTMLCVARKVFVPDDDTALELQEQRGRIGETKGVAWATGGMNVGKTFVTALTQTNEGCGHFMSFVKVGNTAPGATARCDYISVSQSWVLQFLFLLPAFIWVLWRFVKALPWNKGRESLEVTE